MNFEISPKSTEIEASWDNALLYCFSLNIDGKTGWRLPTKQESIEIYESQNNFEKRNYWTSTKYDGKNEALVQNFASGGQYCKYTYVIVNVRAVRDLKDD